MPLLPKLGTDRDWERLAQEDPFWAVAGGKQFHKQHLNDAAQREFFDSGEHQIELIFRLIRKHLDPNFAPRSALDFGCGLGRLVIPLARRIASVTGVDVAETMLREARGWLQHFHITNAELCKGDDSLSNVRGPFDLIHSFIVFQHIAPRRGEAILRRMIDLMHDGSVGVLHFLYGLTRYPLHPGWGTRLSRFKERLWLAYRSLLGKPAMQMNEYQMNALFRILQDAGIRRFHVELSDHGGAYGAVLYFQKRAGDAYLA